MLTEKQQKYQHCHQVKLIYEYLTGEEMLSSNQSRIIEHAKFTYPLLGEKFEKQIKQLRARNATS